MRPPNPTPLELKKDVCPLSTGWSSPKTHLHLMEFLLPDQSGLGVYATSPLGVWIPSRRRPSRTKLIEVVTQLNQSVYELATKPASPEEQNRLHAELFGKWKEHSVRRNREKLSRVAPPIQGGIGFQPVNQKIGFQPVNQ